MENSPPEEAARLISAITAADRGQERAMDFSGVIKRDYDLSSIPITAGKRSLIRRE